MKKFIISMSVLGIFALYSLGIRDKSPVLSKPLSIATTNLPTREATDDGPAQPVATPASVASSTSTVGAYKNGTFKGGVADAYYGNVQVAATISGGKITSVRFIDYPHTHSTSVIINQQAMPYLQQEAIQAQKANVQIVSGATFTSQAFIQSLSEALNQAKA